MVHVLLCRDTTVNFIEVTLKRTYIGAMMSIKAHEGLLKLVKFMTVIF